MNISLEYLNKLLKFSNVHNFNTDRQRNNRNNRNIVLNRQDIEDLNKINDKSRILSPSA